MAEDSRDKFEAARDLFAQSRGAFYEGHREGMDALRGAEGEDLTDRLDGAIRMEGRAIALMGEAIDIMSGVLSEQRHGPPPHFSSRCAASSVS